MLQMKKQSYHLFLFFFISKSFYAASAIAQDTSTKSTALFHVGVILDLNSACGKVARRCISMAMSDFYADNSNYSSRLELHFKDSKGDGVRAASLAIDLINNVGVEAIIGPQTSEEADFLARLGDKAHIPIISFSSISSSHSPTRFPYFVRFFQNDSSQAKAIAAIVKAYRFKEVSLIHDDSHSGLAAIPNLINEILDIGAQVRHITALPPNAERAVIKDTLRKIEGRSSRVFIIHLPISLSTRFFKEAGMMKSRNLWIVTSGFTDLMSFKDPCVLCSVKGIIGVKTHVPSSRKHRKFIVRWRKQLSKEQSNNDKLELNVHALWAYDATFAMAMVARKGGFGSRRRFWSSIPYSKPVTNSKGFFHTGFSQMGSEILKSIRATQFTGLSGEIRLVDGQLLASSFEIVNVTGKGYKMGCWTPRDGLFWSMNSKDPWMTEFSDKVLKIGVPVKTVFPDFININRTSNDKKPNVSGFIKEVFEKVMKNLSYPVHYEYIPFDDDKGNPRGDYNNLTYEVYLKKFDAVVGDITILASRSAYVSFTHPYTTSGVRMIVRKEKYKTPDSWWLLKPLTMELWLSTIAFFILNGILVWIFEHRINPEFQGKPSQQLGKIIAYSCSILVFAHREKLESSYSRFIVNLWVFAVFVLVSSYTANLTSSLTVEKLEAVTNIETLLKDGRPVGYQDGSFVFDDLTKKFNFRNVVKISSLDDYKNALLNGSVSAIFDEIPYINYFINKNPHQFSIVGPTYRTSGFGFVFPKDSPILPDVSDAILNFIEGSEMADIEKDYGIKSYDETLTANITSSRLHLYNFRSVYIIVGMASILALTIFFVSFICKIKRDVILRKLVEGRTLWWRALGIGLYFKNKAPSQDTGQPISNANQRFGGSINSDSVESTPQHIV